MRFFLSLIVVVTALPIVLAATGKTPPPAHPASHPRSPHPITSLLVPPSALAATPAASAPASGPASRITTAREAPASATLALATPQPVPPSPIITPAPTPSDTRLDINTATAEQLAKLPGMDAARAAMVVQYRTTHGAFSSVEGLLDVQGISENRLQLFRGKVRVALKLDPLPAQK